VLVVLTGAYLASVRIVGRSIVSRKEIVSMRADISRLKRENVRLTKQLAVVVDKLELQTGGFKSAAELPAPGRPAGEVPARLVARISKLKEYLAAHPEMADPVMRLLRDDDWVLPVRDIRLDTEAGRRKALAQVRLQAQGRLAEMVAAAVRDYIDSNNGQAPSSAAQLVPYLADPSNTDLLQGLGRPDSTAPVGCLFQKASSVDDWYGSSFYVCDDEFTCVGTGPGLAVEQAIAAFRRATGNPPADASQIAPFIRDPISPAVVNAVFEGLRPSPGAAPVVTQYGGMIAVSGSGDSR
jgi:hypothetical protein